MALILGGDQGAEQVAGWVGAPLGDQAAQVAAELEPRQQRPLERVRGDQRVEQPDQLPRPGMEAGGIPLAVVPAPANHRDDGLLAATLDAIGAVGPLPAQPVVHLDAGYDYQPCRQILTKRGMVGQIATRGIPAPIQTGRRWVIERTHAWGNQYGKLRRCIDRRRLVVAFWLALANAAIVCGRLVRRAWTHYRWDSRPRRRP